MNSDRDGRPEGGDDALAGGDFTHELNEGQVEADAESGSTEGAEDRAADAGPDT
ncbi:hypothetical protein [Microbacterium sp. CPCC 204701]|uniref:hypothetical protein n=1 Tax=Microbacterium sp. CPCC 204701 TaxID=2493084 RepID=UPI0013E3742E|nr:hypothetical protein [Microbacterium sp. CPCC 204701]